MRKIILIMGLFAMACNNSSDKKTSTKDTIKETVQMPEQPALPDTIFHGLGTEPFWSVYVIEGSKIVFHPAEGADVEVPWERVTTTISPDTLTRQYISSANGNRVDMTIIKKECSDGMSEHVHSYEVTLVVNKTKYSGCGNDKK